MIEYAETYIGDCIGGSCDRPATVRVHEDYVLCTLHHEMHLLSEQEDEADLTIGFIKGWRSMADAHGLDFIHLVFDRATFDLAQWREAIKGRCEALDRIEHESEANHAWRVELGDKMKRDAIEYPTKFAEALSELAHYLGEDWPQFAADMTHTAGEKYGEAEAEWLHAQLTNGAHLEPPAGFMADLASGLGLGARQKTKLAMAYTFQKGA